MFDVINFCVAPTYGRAESASEGTDSSEGEEDVVGGLSPTMYDKLRSEATTPFRSVRTLARTCPPQELSFMRHRG